MFVQKRSREAGRVRPTRIDLGDWVIRDYGRADVASLVKYANNRDVWINLRDRFPHPYTRAHAIGWLQHVRAQRPRQDFALASAFELIGGIGLNVQSDVHRRSAEIGYWIGEPFWGRGIATDAVAAMTEVAFKRFSLNRLYAHVFEWNPASARVLEKVGYEYEGRMRKSVCKDGRLIDQLIYAKVC